ncbi:YihY/virulence factor BrkB family protein [Marmoricola sp. RAF53]|uniref:YihY/virulence factor BrkB family protein n=1 Tax=Marmoricola sp. RAF53 TaxID=3233059 RepID=UPI003F966E2F
MRTLLDTVRSLLRHRGQDVAAGLTYYSMLAIFPALLALLSLLGLVGEADAVVTAVIDVLEPLVSQNTIDNLEPLLNSMVRSSGAPLTFAVGVIAALWSASSYVSCFGRAMNTVREVEETRPFWKLKPLMLLITVLSVVMIALALFIIVASGPIATSLADELGVDQNVVDIYEIAKWPVLAMVVVLVVALLFKATPNVRTGAWYKLLSLGSFLGLLVWAAASTGFAFYVANFNAYNRTYGSIAGVIIGLVWLWITNLALLFGAELDAVRDRNRRTRAAEDEVVAEPGGTPDGPPVGAPDEAAEMPAEELLALVGPPPTARESRRREKVVMRESFPRRPGAPPYGPITQPVPDED